MNQNMSIAFMIYMQFDVASDWDICGENTRVAICTLLTVLPTILKRRDIFATQGILDIIISDSGPQFIVLSNSETSICNTMHVTCQCYEQPCDPLLIRNRQCLIVSRTPET